MIATRSRPLGLALAAATALGALAAALPAGHTQPAVPSKPATPAALALPRALVAAGTPVASSLAAKGELAPPIIGGRATWYRADGEVGAAGPLLREYIGRGWRGALVEVHSRGRVVVVRLTDWCSCRHQRRLIDLSDDAFAQLAPLSVGVIEVSIGRVVKRVPDPPPTDTGP